MRFIYATDLHGDVEKYEALYEFAKEFGIDLIHLGADLLPKGSNILSSQEKFIKGPMKEFYRKCNEDKIKVLAFFGNDDAYTRKKYFKKYAELLDETPYKKDEFEFIAYPYVPDYPFPLKTACKYDNENDTPFIGRAIDIGPNGIVEIEDVKKYFDEKGTIEIDLKELKINQNTIVAFHTPPSDCDLDVCISHFCEKTFQKITSTTAILCDEKINDCRICSYKKRILNRVGSKSVYEWIVKNQPRLVLCGHIHESYIAMNRHENKIGNTLVVQPGQMKDLRFVVIDITEDNIRTELVEKSL